MGASDQGPARLRRYERHVENGDFQRYGRDLGATRHRRPTSGSSSTSRPTTTSPWSSTGTRRSRRVEAARLPVVPDVDLLVGGFPCQDYSVARTLRQAHGLVGKKGVLWWEIHRLLRLKLAAGRPIRHLFLENVDRLIKSPTGQRGRDFAVMLASLADLGYEVEWRVANAAEYGFPQKRRRVFIIGRLGRHRREPARPAADVRASWLGRYPLVRAGRSTGCRSVWTPTSRCERRVRARRSQDAVRERRPHADRLDGLGAAVWTTEVEPAYAGRRQVLARCPRGDRGRPGTVLRRRRGPGEVAVPQGREEPDPDQPVDRARVHLRRRADPVPRPHRPSLADDPDRRRRARRRRGSST